MRLKFKQALEQMLKDNEFDNIIKGSKGKDKKAAKEFYDLIKDNPDFDKIPGIVLLMAIHSASILRSVITYMEMEIQEEPEK